MSLHFDPASAEMEEALLLRITSRNGRPMIRGQRLGVEEVLGLLAAGDTTESILKTHTGIERDDVRACLVFARRLVGYIGAAPPGR